MGELFTNELKLKILHVTSRGTIGLIPSSLSMSHWDIAMHSKQNKRRGHGANSGSGALELLESSAKAKAAAAALSECVIPTQVTRKDVVFQHSEFVQHYLRHEARLCVGDKTTVRINLTYAKAWR